MGSQSTITGFTSGSMRRDDKDRKPGKPIPQGERPEGRPMADQLGSGRANSVHAASVDAQTTVRKRQLEPDFWRKQAGLKIFSWEQGAS